MSFNVQDILVQPDDNIAGQGQSSTFLLVQGQEITTGYLLPPMVIKAVILRVTTVGTAGALVRAGLRNVRTPNYPFPGQLLADLGTQIGTAVANITFPVANPFYFPGGPIFVTAVGQGAPATQATIRSLLSNDFPVPWTGNDDPAARMNTQNGVTGALPMDFTSATPISVGPFATIVAGNIKDLRPA